MTMPSPNPPFRLVSSVTVPLTRDVAAEMRNLPPSPTERELSVKRVEFLRDRLMAGLFHPPHWMKAVVDGKTFRANGQHSSEMLVKLDGNFPEGMQAHVDTFTCSDMSALALLFRQCDDRKSARSPADVAGAYQGLETALNDVPKYIAKIGAEGIAWHRRNVRRLDGTPSGDDTYIVFNESSEHDYLVWLGEVFPSGRVQPLMKAPIFAAMYATYRVDQDAADDFWREVAGGGREYEEEYPATVLFDWYQRLADHEMKVKPRQLYQGAVYAWNALRNGKDIRDIRADIKKNLASPI